MATANQNAQGLVLALFNASAGGNLANLAPLASTASATNALGSNLVAVAALVTGKNLSDNTTFRDTLLSNLQIASTSSAYANAKAWVDGQLATPGTDKGTIAGTAVTYLLSLTDATNPYYSVAQKFQARNDVAVTWSTSSAGSAVLSATALIAQQASVDNYVPPPPPVITTSLTTSTTDVLTGSGTGDTFTGSFSNLASTNTLNPTDKIDGVSGPDVLQLSLGANWTGFTTGSVKNVPTVSLSNSTTQNLSWDATGTSGVTSYSLTNTSGRVDLTNVGSGFNTLTVNGGAGTTGTVQTNTTFVSGAAETTGTTDAITLNLNSAGAAATTVSGTTTNKYNVLTLNSFETVNAASTGSNFVAFAGSDLKTLNVSGSGALTLSYVPTTLTSFDASTATGAVTATFASDNASTPTTFPASLATIKTGSGDDAITAFLGGGIVGNATISAGAGTNKLTLTSKANSSSQFTMSGVQTLQINNIGYTTTFSGANTTGLTTINIPAGSSTGSTAQVAFANMGAIDLTFNAAGSTSSSSGTSTAVSSNAGATSDNSGNVTLNESAASGNIASQTQETDGAAFSFSNAKSVTVNYNPFVNATGTITATLAGSLNVNTFSGQTAAGVEQSAWNGTISAPVATSFNLNAAGQIGNSSVTQAAVLSVPKATSGTITNGATAGVMSLSGALLNTLNVTTGNSLNFNTATNPGVSSLPVLQSLTVAVSKGTVTFGDLAQANNLNFSGAGATSAVTVGNLGGTLGSTAVTNGFDLNLTATGLKSGLIIGTVALTAGNNATINASGVTGNVTIGSANTDTIGNSSFKAGNVTVSDNGPQSTFLIGNVTSSGTVNINANGTAKATVGNVVGNSVTVNVNGTDAASTVGSINAKTLADITFATLSTGNTKTITLDSGATASTVKLQGSLANDVITITSASTAQTAITVSGDLSVGTNSLTINDTLAGSVAQNVNISGISNYGTSTITTAAGNDTIVGSSGADTIYAGGGTNTLTGGAGADRFVFQFGDSTILKVNTINDFTANDNDSIIYAGGNLVNTLATGTVSAGAASVNNTSDVTVTVNSAYVATFSGTTATDYATLAQKALLLHSRGGNNAGKYAFFADAGSTYIWIDSGSSVFTNDTIIKLVGVSLPTTAATLGTDQSTTSTGLFGFGA